MSDWPIVQSAEVEEWLDSLTEKDQFTASRHIFLLRSEGPLLGEPHTRQLRGKLRELRFHLDRRDIRISYFFTPGREAALLTVFEKHARREPREIERAQRAMADWPEEEIR